MTRTDTVMIAAILTVLVTGSAGAKTAWIPLPSGNYATMTAEWMVRRTTHFEIFCERQHESVLDAIVRDAERAYARVSLDLQYELGERMPLILVRTGRDTPQDGDQARELVRVSGAPDRDHLVLPIEPVEGRATLLIHELTHQFAFEMIPLSVGMPAWIHEALADHEAGTWTPLEVAQLRDAAVHDAVPSITSRVDLGRAWRHAMFDFLAAEYGSEGLRRYLTILRNVTSPVEAVHMAFGVTADDFDRAFRTWARTR
jgi:hypothetical protein